MSTRELENVLFAHILESVKEINKRMKRNQPLKRRTLSSHAARRLQVFKRTRQKILQRRREFVRAELAEQWSLAS